MPLVDIMAYIMIILTLVVVAGLILVAVVRAKASWLSKAFWIVMIVLALLMVIGVRFRLAGYDPMVFGPDKEPPNKYLEYPYSGH